MYHIVHEPKKITMTKLMYSKVCTRLLNFIKWKIYLRKIFNLILAPSVCTGKANGQIRYSNKKLLSCIWNHVKISTTQEFQILIFDNWSSKNQGSQYRTGGYTSLTTDTIYFGYRLIPVYRFGFTVSTKIL